MKVPHEWHKAFFKNSFYNPASRYAVEKAPAEAAFVLKQLNLKKGAALLDLCCGPGRHAVEFAAKGLDVTGFDFSREYLAEAAARAKTRRLALRLRRGDMRALNYKGAFDAAVNLFTSFGYFPEFSDDLKTLRGITAALKPGGLFLIDIINGDFIRSHFTPRDWYDLGDHYLLEERTAGRDGLNNTWIRINKKTGRIQQKSFFNRLYGRTRLSATLKKAGLRPLKFWGSFGGGPLSADSIRMLCLAKKV